MKESTFEKYKLVVDEWFINGYNQRKAYQFMYPDASDEVADVECSRILRIPKVREYKQEKAKEFADKMNITLEGQLLDLEEIKSLAKDNKSFSDVISALKEQNKLLALYKEHNEQKGGAFTLPLTEFFKTMVSENQ